MDAQKLKEVKQWVIDNMSASCALALAMIAMEIRDTDVEGAMDTAASLISAGISSYMEDMEANEDVINKLFGTGK
jgi:hypothetical protein